MNLKHLAYQIENQDSIKKEAAEKINEKIVGKPEFVKTVINLLTDYGYYIIDKNEK